MIRTALSRLMPTPFAALLALSLAAPQAARADWQLIPKNNHQQFETYGLFIDDTTQILAYGASRYYGTIGGTFALAGNPDAPWHPQVVIIASVNAAMIFADSGRIYSDELDVHAGGAFEFAINPMMRISTGFMHYSGHTADGAVDQDLLGINYNLGDNMLFARFVYDLGVYARAGVTFIPVIHGGPDAQFFQANQFAEFFPLGGLDETQKPSPYISAALSEGGTAQYGNQFTFNAQIGAYIGNHFSADFKPTFRLAVGYYTGADPRLKYYQFKGETTTFYYIGGFFDF
jgi:hypothetical protein